MHAVIFGLFLGLISTINTLTEETNETGVCRDDVTAHPFTSASLDVEEAVGIGALVRRELGDLVTSEDDEAGSGGGAALRTRYDGDVMRAGMVKRLGSHDYLLLQRLRWIGGHTYDDHTEYSGLMGSPTLSLPGSPSSPSLPSSPDMNMPLFRLDAAKGGGVVGSPLQLPLTLGYRQETDEMRALVPRPSGREGTLQKANGADLVAMEGTRDIMVGAESGNELVRQSEHHKGEYEMEEQIGQGSQGEVWRAARLDPDGKRSPEEYVVKRMFDSSLTSGWREVHFGNVLKQQPTNENVVRYVGHYSMIQSTSSIPRPELWLIFYYEGRSLHHHLYTLSHMGALQPSSFWRTMKTDAAGPQLYRCMMKQLLEGLLVTHQLNITHRDVKPSNVIIDVTSNPTRLKLADFGSAVDTHTLAHLYPNPPSASEETVAYSPPETRLGLGSGQRTHAYDVWSVAVLGLEMHLGIDPSRIFAAPPREEALIRSRLQYEDAATVDAAVFTAGLANWGILPGEQEDVADMEEDRPPKAAQECDEIVMVVGTPPTRPKVSHQSLIGPGGQSWKRDGLVAGTAFERFTARMREMEQVVNREQGLIACGADRGDQRDYAGGGSMDGSCEFGNGMEETAIGLLFAMMRFEPYKRLSVAQALAHPWFDDDVVDEVQGGN